MKRLESFLTESKFNELIKERLADKTKAFEYTYEGFLRAVSKFPRFCGEERGLDNEDACKINVAALFAHMFHEMHLEAPWHSEMGTGYQQSQYYLEEPGCGGGNGGSKCDTTDAARPLVAGK